MSHTQTQQVHVHSSGAALRGVALAQLASGRHAGGRGAEIASCDRTDATGLLKHSDYLSQTQASSFLASRRTPRGPRLAEALSEGE